MTTDEGLSLVRGDLCDAEVDALVNAWNRNFIPLWLLVPQGVAKALRKRGGNGPFKAIRRHGLMPLGGAIATDAGTLKAKWMIHVAALHMYWSASARSVGTGYENAIRLAAELGATSMATPLLGAGTGGVSPEKSYALLREAWVVAEEKPARCEVWVFDERVFSGLQ